MATLAMLADVTFGRKTPVTSFVLFVMKSHFFCENKLFQIYISSPLICGV